MQRMTQAIMDADHPVFMLYASDHGEYLNDFGDGFYDHGNRNHLTRFEIEIPFLVVFNRRFLEHWQPEVELMRKRTGAPVSHDNISHTLLGMAGVMDVNYRPQYDLSSQEFIQTPRYVVQSTNVITPLEKVIFNRGKFTGRRE